MRLLTRRGVADAFRVHVIAQPTNPLPIVTFGSTSFFYLQEGGIYIVAVTRCNANAALVFEFLHRFLSLWHAYFHVPLSEGMVKKNFVLLYELLDEILDFGYPQNSDVHTLKMHIANEHTKTDGAVRDDARQITTQATHATPWRRSDVKYKKNECYLDVIETLSVVLEQGKVVRADVEGQIRMKALLSGMPECSVGLNTNLNLHHASGPTDVHVDHCSFHASVQLDALEREKRLHFIPADGEFELMRYHATVGANLPWKVRVAVDETQASVSYVLHLEATMNAGLEATDVAVRIPTPRTTHRVQCTPPIGRAKFQADEHELVWRIPRIQAGAAYVLHAEAYWEPLKAAWNRPPVVLDFSLMMYAASGLAVRYLHVREERSYRSEQWVRYWTRSRNTYLVRI